MGGSKTDDAGAAATAARNASMIFGLMLRSLRAAALMSQEQLANESGLSVRAIRDLEGGRVLTPRVRSVWLLANALGMEGEARREFERMARVPGAARTPALPGGRA